MCINTWVGHPRTRVAEAVEMRGGKVVFKIQPFVLLVLIFVFYHVPCDSAVTEQLPFVLVLETQVSPSLQQLLEEMLSLNFSSALSAVGMTLAYVTEFSDGIQF